MTDLNNFFCFDSLINHHYQTKKSTFSRMLFSSYMWYRSWNSDFFCDLANGRESFSDKQYFDFQDLFSQKQPRESTGYAQVGTNIYAVKNERDFKNLSSSDRSQQKFRKICGSLTAFIWYTLESNYKNNSFDHISRRPPFFKSFLCFCPYREEISKNCFVSKN